jgi:hypothetical protein
MCPWRGQRAAARAGRPSAGRVDARWGGWAAVDEHSGAGRGDQDGVPIEEGVSEAISVQHLKEEWQR